MSLAARCPWCETVFRLTEGQVSAKGGMARCGVCNHTFNALDALLSDSAVAAIERGAQAREANQEATARANEPAASTPSQTIPIPVSIRKIFGGSSTPPPPPPPPPPPAPATPAPATPTPPAAPISAPVSPTKTWFSVAAPDAGASPSLALNAAPVGDPPSASLVAAKAPEPNPVAPPAARVEAVPVPIPVSEPASTLAAPRVAEHVEELQPVAPPAQPAPVPPATAPAALIESSSSEGPQAAPAPALPIDYQVEMPNYDAVRAAALADAERLQREQEERQEQQRRRKTLNASTAIENQLDEVQTALSPVLAAEQAEREPVDISTTSATLNSLRLQHAAAQAASKADLLREQERLGPNTFQPSFLMASPAAGRFRRTRRFFGGVLVLILSTCLLGQATYWWRSEVAMRVPQTRPYLVRACERLHCDLEPPAQIDQLSIESSELVAAPGAAGSLAFTALVRNHSANALAYPAIEITLTDARDQAILRRVFLPDAYLGDTLGAKRLAGLSGNSEYTLKLTFNTSGVATAGYRAGIFYP